MITSLSTTPGPCEYLDFVECHVAVVLWKVFSPLLFIIGIVGNSISVAVLSRKHMRNSTTSVYLRFLAVIDTLVLVFATLRELIFYTTHVDVQELSDLTCRIHCWLAFSFTSLSAWLLSVLAIDRLVAVKFPIWSKANCSKYIAVIISVVVTTLVFTINSHMLLYLNRTEVHVTSYSTNATIFRDIICQPNTDTSAIFWFKTWPLIVLILFSFLPMTCLVTCSIMLSSVVSRRRNPLPNQNNLGMLTEQQQKHYRSLTKMLITICVFFVLISLPVCTYLIVEPYIFDDETPKDMVTRILTWAIVALLLYCNNAFNFILYCLSGSLFRRELSAMLLTWRSTVTRCGHRRVVPGDRLEVSKALNQPTAGTSGSSTIKSCHTSDKDDVSINP